jgi:monothiol glutaredoxin
MKDTVQERIEREISGHDVVLFMKGTPVFPRCGFSNLVVQVLSHLGVKFKGIDVLSDPALRQGIKGFSDWPTIPQLYVNGEFVGGCDIVREMFETGEPPRAPTSSRPPAITVASIPGAGSPPPSSSPTPRRPDRCTDRIDGDQLG